MPESIKTLMKTELEAQSEKIKKTTKTLGGAVDSQVDLAQNQSKAIAKLKRDIQQINRGKKRKLIKKKEKKILLRRKGNLWSS